MATMNKKPVRRQKTTAETPVVNVPLTKEELAKKKVEELLQGVTLTKEDKEVVVDRLEEATKGKNVEWLEGQVAGLTEQNKKLQEDYSKLLNEFKLKGGAPTGDIAIMQKNIETIFFELDAVYTGSKFGKPYEEAKIRPLLNKLMQLFPFLSESLKRKKTVPHQMPQKAQAMQQLPHGQGQQRFASNEQNFQIMR